MDKAEVRLATEGDAPVLARLLRDFNCEFGDDAPAHEVLSERIRSQIDSGDGFFLLSGDGPDGFAQVALHPSLYSPTRDAYLGELYVAPTRRGRGIGRALLEAAMDESRARGAVHMDLSTSTADTAARGLYESAGFTDREGDPEGPQMIYYERDL